MHTRSPLISPIFRLNADSSSANARDVMPAANAAKFLCLREGELHLDYSCRYTEPIFVTVMVLARPKTGGAESVQL
jgi:hypothetical protein